MKRKEKEKKEGAREKRKEKGTPSYFGGVDSKEGRTRDYSSYSRTKMQ